MRNLANMLTLACAALLMVGAAQAQPYLAFQDGGTGNQNFTFNMGNDFTVSGANPNGIYVTSLCAYNANGPGWNINTSISVAIFTNPGGVQVAGPVTFSFANPGTLVTGTKDACLPITPVFLPAGNYSVVAVGFNANDPNGNSAIAGFVQSELVSAAVSYPGTGEFDTAAQPLRLPPANGGAFSFSAGSFQSVVQPPVGAKSFLKSPIDISENTQLTITVTNNNATFLTNLAFTDNLPSNIVVAAPTTTAIVSNTCGGTATVVNSTSLFPTGNPPSSISLSGGILSPNSNCSIIVTVKGFADGGPLTNSVQPTATESGTLTASAGTAPITVLPLIDGAGIYQLRYLSNLNQGDSYINLTNAGTLNGFDPVGRICANVYTFDPAEELISCCACPITPNGLNSLSARNDLISNTLTPGVPTSITVKLVVSIPGTGGTCNASTVFPQTVVRGLRAWATTLHLNTSGSPAVGYQTTETPFSKGRDVAELSVSELTKLTSYCAFIQANGSGFGICKSCRAGALRANDK